VSEGWASAHARVARASTHMPAVNGTGLSSHTPHGVRHAPSGLSARLCSNYHELRKRKSVEASLNGDGPVFGDGPEAAEASCHSHQGRAPASCSAGVLRALLPPPGTRDAFRCARPERVACAWRTREATRARHAQADL
jgi:hypothetical protein